MPCRKDSVGALGQDSPFTLMDPLLPVCATEVGGFALTRQTCFLFLAALDE